MLKILIVGSGYAGSILACYLVKSGMQVTVVDRNEPVTATKVSTGIMLPVTGRRLAKTHNADTIIPVAGNFYDELGDETKISCFTRKDVLQIFNSPGNMNEWFARSNDEGFDQYTGKILSREEIPDSIKNTLGGIVLRQSGFVVSDRFLVAAKRYCGKNTPFPEEDFHYEDLQVNNYNVVWKNETYDKLIFCEGHYSTANKWFRYIPFKPAKGELLDFYSDTLNDKYIINGSVFILPLGDGIFRAGSTYNWTDLTNDTTAEAATYLEEGIANLINCEYKITGQKAGIRPSISDRRPVIGFHPEFKQLGIFNGLGTKGAMLGPYYAKQLSDLINSGTEPDADVNLRRFDSLYQEL